MAAKRGARYGVDFKSFSILVTPAEHQQIKVWAAEFGVTVSDVCRLALADKEFWMRAKSIKEKEVESS